MTARVAAVLVALLGSLPLSVNHALGSLWGRLVYWLGARQRRVTETNLALCFPDLGTGERDALCRESLRETGRAFTESAWIWRRPRAQLESMTEETDSVQRLREAETSGRGLIVATPHLGAWELCNLPLTRERRITYFYRTPRIASLDSRLIAWRANLDADPAALDARGIKRALKLLRAGEVVGILPDQEPERGGGVFAPLFGVPAYTMHLLAKLARSGRAEVLFCVAERRHGAAGWRVHFLPPDADIADADPAIAAAALNRSIEACIRLRPAQYLWSYRRFRRLPDGGRRDYR